MKTPSASRVATRHRSGAQSADERYHHHLKNVQTSMKNIQRLLDKHLREQVRKPTDWGFVGDMEKVSEDLKDIETFLR